MLNRFEKTFGSPDDVVILMGDWSENRTMRFQEPTMGKGMRRLFRNRGYKLYLVDEYNTSKCLYESGEELVKFRKDKNGKPVHRVLTTALIKELSERNYVHTSHPDSFIKDLIETTIYRPTIINRDLNGSLNIRSKGMYNILGLDEPVYMCRSKRPKNVKEEKLMIDIKIDLPDIPLIVVSKRVAKQATKSIKIMVSSKKVVIRKKRGY